MKKLLIALVAIACIGTATAQSKAKAKKVSQKAKTEKVSKTSKSSFIVISKKDLNLRVYDVVNGDTVLVKEFPDCLSRNK